MMATHTNKDSKNIMHLIKPQTIGAEIGVWMGNTSTLFLKNSSSAFLLISKCLNLIAHSAAYTWADPSLSFKQ